MNPIEIDCETIGDVVKVSLTLRGGLGPDDWVTHYVDIQIFPEAYAALSADEVGLRYAAPMLNMLASQVARHKEPA